LTVFFAGFFAGGFLGAGRFAAGFFVAFCGFFAAGFAGLAARLPFAADFFAGFVGFFVVFVAAVSVALFFRVVRADAAFFDAAARCALEAMTTPVQKLAARLAPGGGQGSAG
jgi:hypothetical protein